MTNKIKDMKSIANISIVAGLAIFLVACGGNAAKDNKSALGDKKVQLEKLKKEKSNLDAEIRTLEQEIGAADPSAAGTQRLVAIAVVDSGSFTHFIDLQGKVDAENVAYVAPRGQGGTVKAVYVQEGQAVRKGQVILKLDDAVARQQLASAQQQIAGLESQAKLAQSVYERQQNLWRQNIGSEVQVMEMKTRAEAAASQLNAARANVQLAQEQVNQSSVTAEISGTIDLLNVKVGEFFSPQSAANPNTGVRIVNTSNLKVRVQVPENYISRIKVGSPLEVVLPELNNRVIKSKVTVAGRLIDPTTRSFYVEGRLPADKDLRPNQTAIVKIEDYTKASAITVPLNVVQSDEKGKYLFVVDKSNNKLVARRRVVTIGESYGGMIEITSGLKAGEQIVTEGYQTLYDGQAITTGK
jgi:RND family efflux transporter MFP subunit